MVMSKRVVFERHIVALPFLEDFFVVTNTYIVTEFYTLKQFVLLHSFTNCYVIFSLTVYLSQPSPQLL